MDNLLSGLTASTDSYELLNNPHRTEYIALDEWWANVGADERNFISDSDRELCITNDSFCFINFRVDAESDFFFVIASTVVLALAAVDSRINGRQMGNTPHNRYNYTNIIDRSSDNFPNLHDASGVDPSQTQQLNDGRGTAALGLDPAMFAKVSGESFGRLPYGLSVSEDAAMFTAATCGIVGNRPSTLDSGPVIIGEGAATDKPKLFIHPGYGFGSDVEFDDLITRVNMRMIDVFASNGIVSGAGGAGGTGGMLVPDDVTTPVCLIAPTAEEIGQAIADGAVSITTGDVRWVVGTNGLASMEPEPFPSVDVARSTDPLQEAYNQGYRQGIMDSADEGYTTTIAFPSGNPDNGGVS